jgi:prevent-host-death family protein
MERWAIRDLQRRGASIVSGVERTGEPAVITRRGRPVAAVVPLDRVQPPSDAVDRETSIRRALDAVRGTADTDLTTDEIMRMTRGDDRDASDPR